VNEAGRADLASVGAEIPARASQRQLKLKLMLMRSASTRLAATSWRSQLSKRIDVAGLGGVGGVGAVGGFAIGAPRRRRHETVEARVFELQAGATGGTAT